MVPPRTDTASPWPPSAPPWPMERRAQATTQGPSGGQKRSIDQITAAEHTLGKLAAATAATVQRVGWETFVRNTRGESNLAPDVAKLPHKAARLLEHLRKRGATVLTTTAPWSPEQCDAAMNRGPHKSAYEETEFVCTKVLDFCKQGYWAVLPYHLVRQWLGLRISPLGVVPQRDRRPRLIVDYSFTGLNKETVPLAPKESMQFGRALQRILQTIVRANPKYGPVLLSKIDIADGFYRVWLHWREILKLGVALPSSSGRTTLVAFPLALPMGWVESPPYFTVLTETACDLANTTLRTRDERARSTVHRLEAVAATPPADPVKVKALDGATHSVSHYTPSGPPIAAVDVYVDDFLLMAQTHHQSTKVLRHTLHAIDQVFRPLGPQDPPHRKEPASVKKMLQGDASWSTHKRILGWDLDTCAQTINLPPHRVARLYELLDHLQPPRKRVSVTLWHKLLGELRSMSTALPGARGLFSVLQYALGTADRNRVRLTEQVYSTLDDFRAIADSLSTRPTRLQELVPAVHPHYLGASDACQRGMGGVWFSAAPGRPPVLWRHAFSDAIQSTLVTFDNPQGRLSISDLELTAMIAHKDVLAHHADLTEKTLWIATDNRAALSWSDKGSSTSVSARAFLLRFNALHQRLHRYVSTHAHIAGKANVMADDASRLWNLSDTALLTHFNLVYPQESPWQMLHLPHSTHSALIGALLRKRQPPVCLLNASSPVPPTGACGVPSANPSLSTHNISPPTPSPCYKCLPNACEQAPSYPAVDPSGLARWRTSSAPLARRMPVWGPRTLA